MKQRPETFCRVVVRVTGFGLAVLVGFLSGWLLSASAAAPDNASASDSQGSTDRWWKGNTHTHTLNSDGDSSPGEVAHWYRDHDYDFLVLSDHNYYTKIDELQREFEREVKHRGKEPFLLVPGEEVTDRFEKAELHVNAFDSSRLIGKQGGKSKGEVLQRSVDAILSAGGIPSVNHPNFVWSLSAQDLVSIKGLKHFEIFNGHPSTHDFGGGGLPSLEEMWDSILSTGTLLYGVAVDDAHHFQKWGARRSNPGKGWIQVRAATLTRKAIREAFERGDFYASTGVTLSDVRMEGDTLSVTIKAEGKTRFTTEFVGTGSAVLQRSVELESSYTLRPGDPYVRCRVRSSLGEYAWTQPLMRR